MANHKSAKTRIVRNKKRALINGNRVSRIRTFVKKVESAIEGGDQTVAKAAFTEAMSEMAKGVARGVIHRNTLARKSSRLSARIKAMGAAA